MEIRHKIVNEVVHNWKEHIDRLNATCVEIKYESSEKYVEEMGYDGKFGTDFEVGIFCRIYKKTVKVFSHS